MIHANIMEEPWPERSRSDETVAPCTSAPSLTEQDYFRRRATQEAEAARSASCLEARLAHQQMAEWYRLLCLAQDNGASPDLASELTAFRFDLTSTN